MLSVPPTTLAAAGDERINFIVDFFLSSIRVNNSQQYALTVNYEAQVSQSHTDGGGGGWGVRSVSQSVPNRRVGGKQCPGQPLSLRQLRDDSALVSQSVTDSWGTCPGQSVRHRQMGEVPRSVSQSQTVGGRAQVSQSVTDRWGMTVPRSDSQSQTDDGLQCLSQSVCQR